MVYSGMGLVEIATRMNLLHFNEGEEARHRYVTAVFLRLDPSTNVLEAVNAGHTPVLLQSADGAVKKIKASGTPIGLLPFSSYSVQTIALAPGDRLLAYTDGMTEVFQGDDEFGEPRLTDAFAACTRRRPAAVLDALWETLAAFAAGSEQSDDMTALVVARVAAAESAGADEAESLELQLPSRLGCEKIAMNAAAELARRMGFAEDRIEHLKTAVAEACINAMEHGNQLDETLPIGVVLSMEEDELVVKVKDQGAGPGQGVSAPDIDKKMHEEERPRGMGMFLIQSLMDEVEWVKCPHEGSYARMVIRMKPDEDETPQVR